MILDQLENWRSYAALHPGFKAAFEFLTRQDLQSLPVGRHEIDSDRIYAIVAKDAMRSREDARLEAHRKYIDIQMPLSSGEEMGWKSLGQCQQPDGDYDQEKDLEFFRDQPERWLTVPARSFAVFFPDDAHAPLVGEGTIHKVIVKVAV